MFPADSLFSFPVSRPYESNYTLARTVWTRLGQSLLKFFQAMASSLVRTRRRSNSGRAEQFGVRKIEVRQDLTAPSSGLLVRLAIRED